MTLTVDEPTTQPEPESVPATTEPMADQPAAPGQRSALDNLRMAVLAVIVLAAAVFAFNGLDAGRSNAGPTDRDVSALSVLAADLVSSAKSDGGAVDAIGGYLPGTGMVLTVHLADADADAMEGWVRQHLDPYADQLALLPEGESIVVTVDSTAGTNARVWSLSPAEIARNDGTWDQLVAPATFVGSDSEVAVAASSASPAADTASADTDAAEPAIDEPVAAETVAAEPDVDEPVVEETATEPIETTPDEPVEDVDTGAADGDNVDVVASAGGDRYPDVDLDGAFGDDSLWEPTFGSWTLKDGVYSQSDATGYGYSAEYQGATPDEFDVSVVLRAPSGDINGGIIYGQPERGAKNGAAVIDITGEGSYLRWGEYDATTGDWAFLGGAPIDPPLQADQWAKLGLEVRADTTNVFLNDEFIAPLDAVDPNLYVSLVVSVANIEFKNFEVIEVTPASTEPVDDTTADEPVDDSTTDDGDGDGEIIIDFDLGDGADLDETDGGADEFEGDVNLDRRVITFDDDLTEWTLLSGSWVAQDGILQQANGSAYDQMTHFSSFERDDYRVEVQLRPLEGSDFSGGLLFNIENFGQRANSQIFDIVDNGSVIRWAGYDQNGVFSYVGGLRTSSEFDPAGWHTLAVEVRGDRAEFFVDGEIVGASTNVGETGYVGVVTSLAAMEFRDFSITTL